MGFHFFQNVIHIPLVILKELVGPAGSVTDMVDFVGPILIRKNLAPEIAIGFIFLHPFGFARHEIRFETPGEISDSVKQREIVSFIK